MLRRIAEKALCLGRDKRGVALVLFVIVMTPILILIAVAIDLSQFLVMKQQLQAAADAAALTIGKNPSLSDEQATSQAQAYIAANYPAAKSIGTLTSVSVTRPTNTTVNVTAQALMNTSFLQVAGYNTLPVTVNSQTTIAQNKMEVVLVLDNTGSMNQTYGSMTGIAGLRSAATTLVNTLFTADPTGQYLQIAVVPFTAAVNVGTQYKTASWMDTKGVGKLTRENLNVPAGEGLIAFASQLRNASWGGCVRQRNEPYDLEDVAPTSAIPDTLFTPYFAPSEPQGLYNSYLPDGSFPRGTTQAQIQYDVTKYQNGVVQGQPNYGPNFVCAVQPIIPLTNDQAAIVAEINAMQASGATVIPAGLVWGWHVISPIVAPVLFPSNAYQPVSYTDTSTIKVIILLTDGEADVQLTYNYQPPTGTTNGFDQSIYNAYGYGTGPHLNILPLPGTLLGVQDQPDYNLDQKEIALCNNIKAVTGANGSPGRILIYAIGFGSVIDNSSLQILQQCATSASTYFYNPTSEELVTTFQNIAIGLNELRLSQ